MRLRSVLSVFSIYSLFVKESLVPKELHPYWINLEYVTKDIHTSNNLIEQTKNITISGYPRTNQCEHYRVVIHNNEFIFDNKDDLVVFTNYLHDELRKSRFYFCKLKNNIGFESRTFGYEGLIEFQKALELLMSVSRLNASDKKSSQNKHSLSEL